MRSLLFSIKESVFKCVFPATRTYIDFRQVTVSLSGPDSFRAEISAAVAVPDRLRIIGGRYAATEKFVLTMAEVPAAP